MRRAVSRHGGDCRQVPGHLQEGEVEGEGERRKGERREGERRKGERRGEGREGSIKSVSRMKSRGIRYIIAMLTAILSLLPTGCKEGELDPSLVKADEMLREGRDLEAWLLLDNQKYAKGKVCEWDYALYCVLRLQAEERNGKLLTDGLAADALEYYKDKDDDGYHAGLAWYFQGWESLLANNYDDALMELREAKRLMDGEHCLRYQYLSRNYLSAIYSKYNADEDCVRELSEALGYAKQLKNERYMSSTLLNLAKSLRRVGKVDSSLLCLRELIVLGTMKNMKDVVVDEIGLA
jgi:tetratricopeptide (TPR) repeat protein